MSKEDGRITYQRKPELFYIIRSARQMVGFVEFAVYDANKQGFLDRPRSVPP